MTSLTPTLAVINGVPCASSLDIAEHFEKRHVDVMRAINNSITQVPEEFAQRNFAFSDYRDSTGRTLPKCDLTHDGFSFVVMGFTGKEAAKWKVVYITAFREMAERLTTAPVPSPTSPDAPITPDQQCTLQAIVKGKVEAIPADTRPKGLYPKLWSRFNNHFRLARYAQLPQSRMSEAIDYLMKMELAPKVLPPTDKDSLTVAPEALSFRSEFPADMEAGRKDALRKIRSIMDSMLAAREAVRMFCYPQPVNMNRPHIERLTHNARHDFHAAALDCLSAAYNALEAGYRLERLVGRG